MKIELSKYNFKAERKDIEAFLNSISGNNIEKLKNDFKNNQLDFELFVEEKKPIQMAKTHLQHVF